MTGSDPRNPPSSAPDGGGVRVLPKARAARTTLLAVGLTVVAVAGAAGWWWLAGFEPQAEAVVAASPLGTERNEAASAAAPAGVARRPAARVPRPIEDLPEEPYELPSLDPNDIAYYIRPGDPEPTAAELIEALNHAGIHTGIGAFNPPGTRPALEGLAVPDDYELPEGYVRHYQSTDEGELIDPILMFSPDYVFFDSLGEPIVLPEDLVVTEALAPPDLPLRRVRIPGQ